MNSINPNRGHYNPPPTVTHLTDTSRRGEHVRAKHLSGEYCDAEIVSTWTNMDGILMMTVSCLGGVGFTWDVPAAEVVESTHQGLQDWRGENGSINLDVVRSGNYDIVDRDAVTAALLDEVEHLRSTLAQVANDRDAAREVTTRQMSAMRCTLDAAEAAGVIDEFGQVTR